MHVLTCIYCLALLVLHIDKGTQQIMHNLFRVDETVFNGVVLSTLFNVVNNIVSALLHLIAS